MNSAAVPQILYYIVFQYVTYLPSPTRIAYKPFYLHGIAITHTVKSYGSLKQAQFFRSENQRMMLDFSRKSLIFVELH